MSEDRGRAPVAFFVFNRPQLTERVFAAIAAARPPRLLVVADGPRADHPEDPDLVARTRAVIDGVDWPCEVRRCYSDVNLGCRIRVSSGLDWVFSQVDRAIIIEDDCLPDQTFFPFAEALLERYEHDERVHMIAGTNALAPERFSPDSYYFSRCYTVWGWATWARAWSHYDLAMARWPEVRDDHWLEQLLGGETEARIAREIFDATHAGRVPTWDFQWVFSSWLAGGVSITPEVNLVSNLGYGELATNERREDHPLAARPTSPMQFPLRHPADVKVLQNADRAVWRFSYPDRFGLGQTPPRRSWWAVSRRVRTSPTS
jgi:hypothetical protein